MREVMLCLMMLVAGCGRGEMPMDGGMDGATSDMTAANDFSVRDMASAADLSLSAPGAICDMVDDCAHSCAPPDSVPANATTIEGCCRNASDCCGGSDAVFICCQRYTLAFGIGMPFETWQNCGDGWSKIGLD